MGSLCTEPINLSTKRGGYGCESIWESSSECDSMQVSGSPPLAEGPPAGAGGLAITLRPAGGQDKCPFCAARWVGSTEVLGGGPLSAPLTYPVETQMEAGLDAQLPENARPR